MKDDDIRTVLAAVCREYCKYPSHSLEGGYPLEFACDRCPVSEAVKRLKEEKNENQ